MYDRKLSNEEMAQFSATPPPPPPQFCDAAKAVQGLELVPDAKKVCRRTLPNHSSLHKPPQPPSFCVFTATPFNPPASSTHCDR
jgi:hypothetical protein